MEVAGKEEVLHKVDSGNGYKENPTFSPVSTLLRHDPVVTRNWHFQLSRQAWLYPVFRPCCHCMCMMQTEQIDFS